MGVSIIIVPARKILETLPGTVCPQAEPLGRYAVIESGLNSVRKLTLTFYWRHNSIT